MFLEIIFLIMLCITAVSDIKYRRIPNYMVILMLIIGGINLVASETLLPHIIGIAFPAIVLLAFRKRHHIGFGDIKLTIAIGLYYGYLPAGIILVFAMLLCACYGLLMKLKKHLEIKTVPFAPFIFVFCLLAFLIEQI